MCEVPQEVQQSCGSDEEEIKASCEEGNQEKLFMELVKHSNRISASERGE